MSSKSSESHSPQVVSPLLDSPSSDSPSSDSPSSNPPSSSSHSQPFGKYKKMSRREEAESLKKGFTSQIRLLDEQYHILTSETRKILDIGFAPGHWMSYIAETLAKLHDVEQDKLYTKKIMILGFDILFKNPPKGTSSIQGNIFSKMAQGLVMNHFKDFEIRNRKLKSGGAVGGGGNNGIGDIDDLVKKSYFDQEKEETEILNELAGVFDKKLIIADDNNNNNNNNNNNSNKNNSNEDSNSDDWKINLVLSDLSRPLKQQSGFYDHSETHPYIRYNSNKGLNHSIINPTKANLDLAEASILLMQQVLKTGGKYVLRLSCIKVGDSEIDSIKQKLQMLFNDVIMIDVIMIESTNECIFICNDKR
ncbi:MRM2 [Candida oxycetoniae]|uniref:rRNA methyltransferase 2, mitochondrial n=1 Tax=Candida oxycetoniae TaxID=497107 RepID=A0AAI9WWI0_9ASCO|nr:MRM2 [Candida oxycetoniae]KAI3403052.2 MRM2 [Candida oxycetoniae]